MQPLTVDAATKEKWERGKERLRKVAEVRYIPLCPECHMLLDAKMTADERIQHVLDCLEKKKAAMK